MAGRTFTRVANGVGNRIRAEYVNELQVALEDDDARIDAKPGIDDVQGVVQTELSNNATVVAAAEDAAAAAVNTELVPALSSLTTPISSVVTSETDNTANFVANSTATVALRVLQNGGGAIAKFRNSGGDRLFVQNSGEVGVFPSSGGRGVTVQAPAWTAGQTYNYGNKDGIFYINQWTDASGLPYLSGAFQSYAKGFGMSAAKTGAGNMDAFWATIAHQGNDEVGVFIGDASSTKGGNAWGVHAAVSSATTENVLIGGSFDIARNAQGASKATTTLAAAATAGDTTISATANPGTGRFKLDSGAVEEFVSILSVSGAGPYTATLANPLAYAHGSGAALATYHAYSRGVHVRSSGTYDPDVALLIDRQSAATGEWGDHLLVMDGAGPNVRARIIGNKAAAETIPALNGTIMGQRLRVDSRTSAGAAFLQMTGPTSQEKRIHFYTENSMRYTFGADAGAETGGEAGTNFSLISHYDTGAPRYTVFSTNRGSGIFQIGKGLAITTKAGVPSDADFTGVKPNGLMVLDETNSRLYMRVGGVWKYATLT